MLTAPPVGRQAGAPGGHAPRQPHSRACCEHSARLQPGLVSTPWISRSKGEFADRWAEIGLRSGDHRAPSCCALGVLPIRFHT